jgi:D-alanyl-D-alanine carboxypeptidase/D-alanyl-D-alanine-endopeptidase (penicillin-binding protein 4)
VTFLRFATCALLSCVSLAFGDLQSDVQKLINAADLNKGIAGVCIIDTATNKELVSINASKQMIPASNQKLITSGTALHVLGPTFKFKTRLISNNDNLTILGDGDPTIGDPELLGLNDWSQENIVLDAELKPWVDAVKVAGIKNIKTIFVDDRIFDKNFVHPSWPADQINNWYCAQVSGLNYHLNVVHFYPAPMRGKTATLGDIAPRMQWESIVNKTTSKAGKNYKSSFWVARLPNSNTMTARGNVNAVHKVPVKVAFHDPAIVFGNTFAALLKENGIFVGKVEHVAPSSPQARGKVIYTHTTPLQVALRRSNADSHNLYAESLLKRISAQATGRSGTFDEGSSIATSAINQRLNTDTTSTVVADGSGMSRNNKISPRTLANWLSSFKVKEDVGRAFIDSLATPGNGTLDNRFKGIDLGKSNVHAKSGYLQGVCALSGYITFQERSPIVFSIIVNGVKGTVKDAKKVQEQIISVVIKNQ